MRQQKIALISATQAFELKKEPNVIFIDLRSREEYEKAHIGKAFSLTIEQIEGNDYCLAKEYKYVLYCNHGGVSMQAASLMAEGETEVYTLVGGFEEYRTKYIN